MQQFPKPKPKDTKEEIKRKSKLTVIFCSSFLIFMIAMGVIVYFMDKSSYVKFDTSTIETSVISQTSNEESSYNTRRVNINIASKKELMSVDGIGEKTADAILNYRYKYGRFISVEELADIDGIGSKTLEKIRPFITVG